MVGNAWVVWRLVDHKPGHENQTLGLVDRLGELQPIEVHTLPAPTKAGCLIGLFRGGLSGSRGLPDPTLILGAGHRTHLAVLTARRTRGGAAVILMKPTLPIRWFDLCLIPMHDRVTPRSNVVLTRGVLNAVRQPDHRPPGRGLILIGGPSAHYQWSDRRVVEQVRAIVQRDKERAWSLTTSRRTPASFLSQVTGLGTDNLHITPCEKTPPDWVPEHLAASEHVWVTADSVSMVYEALTAGAAVGILNLAQTRSGRVSQGLGELVEGGWVTLFERWQPCNALKKPPTQLNEAQRCARLISDHVLRQE